jgi:hypothetical protein
MNRDLFNLISQSSLGWRTSQEQTYDLARTVLARGVPGDFVECGVYAGASCALMAHAILDHNSFLRTGGHTDVVHNTGKEARVHLFDNFTGVPTLGAEDDPTEIVEGSARCSREQVERNMENWGVPASMLVYHEGDFAETIPNAGWEMSRQGEQAIALLRLDGDLYRSTKSCLEYLYPLVSPGGYVIVDDYNLAGCRQAVADYFEGNLLGFAPAPIAWRKHE